MSQLATAEAGAPQTAPTPGTARRSSRGGRLARSFVRRLVELVTVILIVVLATSVIARLVPGSPSVAILGDNATPEAVAKLNSELGLDKPIWDQIGTELTRYAQGDLGTSLTEGGKSVGSLIVDALPVTLTIIGLAILISLLIGVPVGLVAGATRKRSVEGATTLGTSILLAIPPFATASLLLLVFALKLHIAPGGGWGAGLLDDLYHAWLPALVLGLLLVTPVERTVARSAREASRSEYVDAARSRGSSERGILFGHVLPVAALPLITLIGFNASVLLGGAIIVESVFGLPGFGQVVGNAVLARDYPTIAGVTVVAAVFVVLFNFLTDIAASVADPRLKRADVR
jgi:peptide/nickel transport system permease protein